MTGIVKLTIVGAMTAIATSQTVAALFVNMTDSAGTVHSSKVPVSSITPDASGGFSVEVDFTGVPTGAFSGNVQAFDLLNETAGGQQPAPVGAAVSFTGTAQNMQPIPTAVTVTLA